MSNIFFKSKGKGLPVLFIHGFCETHEIWEPFIDLVTPAVQIITIDLPGFGKSRIPHDQLSLETLGELLNDWVNESGIDRPVIIGHSLGGYIGLAMAHLKPTLFSGLVLFHSTALPDSEERRFSRIKVIEFVKKNGVKRFMDSFIPGLFFDKSNPYISKAYNLGVKTELENFLFYTEAMRDRPSRVEVLRGSQFPILILAGEEDTILPIGTLVDQSRLNSEILLHTLKNTGHMGMFEAEMEAAKVLNDFIFRVHNPRSD